MRARKQPAILAPLSPGRRARARHLLAAYVADWRVVVAFGVVTGALLVWMGLV